MIDQFAALGKTNFVGKDGFNWWIGQIAPPKSWRNINVNQSLNGTNPLLLTLSIS